MRILQADNRGYQGESFFIVNSGIATELDFDTRSNRPKGRDDYQLIGVTKGCMYMYSENSRRIEEGSLYLFKPGEPQHYGCKKEDLSSYFWVHFKGNFCAVLLSECALLDKQHYPGLIQKTDVSTIENIVFELTERNPGYNAKVLGLLMVLLSNISRRMTSSNSYAAKYGSLSEAIRSMQQDPAADQSVHDYANLCSLSSSHFLHAFKQRMGITPMQYKNRLLFEKAAYLLSNTDLPVKEVAVRCGIDDQLYFSKKFKQQSGITPTQYRNAYR